MPLLLSLPSLAAIAVITMVLLLTYAWEATFGQLIEAVISVLEPVSIHIPGVGRYHVFGTLITFLRGINSLVHRLSAIAGQANTIIWNQFVHHLALAWQAIGESIDLVSHETARALQYLRDHKIQALILAWGNPLVALVWGLKDQIRSLTADVAHVIAHPLRPLTKTVIRVEKAVAAIPKIVYYGVPALVAKAVAVPFPRLGRVEREAGAARDWIKSHARLLTAAGVTGLLVAALSRLGLGWTRCTRVGRVGKAVCGMNTDYLDDLLAASLAIFGTISLVEVAKEMQGITPEVTAAVRLFTRAA